jgi:murein DD-endopeptidase MepM/ murein hydrolase activator NlpD
MIVPERGKGFKSFRVPKVIFRGIVILLVVSLFFLGILAYDYFEILRQGQKNKYLSIENAQLKEQVEIFDKKLNSLIVDIERIQVFEKKLKIITGIEDSSLTKEPLEKPDKEELSSPSVEPSSDKSSFINLEKEMENAPEYQKLLNLHEEKIAQGMGIQSGYQLTKTISTLTNSFFNYAAKYASVDYKIQFMKNMLSKLETSVNLLDQHLLDKDSFIKSTPTIWPARGWVTSYFGIRKSEFSGENKMHEGVDIGSRIGSKIIAPADGMITFAGAKPGFGYYVQIDHGYGLETIFAHASSLVVRKGDKIKRGELLARIGSTGLSTGPHVHYEVRVNGTPVDPMHYILD